MSVNDQLDTLDSSVLTDVPPVVTNKKSKAEKAPAKQVVTIAPPNFQVAHFGVRTTAHFVMNQFGKKARDQYHAKQEAGSTAKKGAKREGKNFQEAYEEAIHYSTEGWIGVPASAFRNAFVSACRLVGFKMTLAKLALFVIADGVDRVDGTPLVKITKGEPKYSEHYVRNETGVIDLRARPMWDPGMEMEVRVRFDADLFKLEDVANLMMRVGAQVGIGEGRPDSKNSCGMGWGTFEIISKEVE